MRRYFPRGPWHGPFAREVRGWQLVLLDSTEPGRIGGALAAEDISAMEGLLGASKARFSLIALHHQPVAVNSYWIDRYALARPEPFLEALDRQSGVRCVTWGHVHQDFSSERNGVRLLGAPSSVCNSLPERERFTPDLSGPACRWISLGADGSVETGLLRAQSSAGRTSQRMR
jgi:Icc protein